mmetsp:Transcript_6184/g.5574  ORF Transcript_6184/g.5574 Transcript_6184/m.5574 type:complete len:401 (+) Transcript_6184:795-1997(+)
MKRRNEEEEDDQKRDIIEEYHNFASRVYAGIAREGLSIDKLSNKYEVQPISLTTYQGVHDLVMNMNPNILETKVNIHKIVDKIEKNYTRLEISHKQELVKAQKMLEGKQKKEEEARKDDIKNVKDIETRPDTPTKIFGPYVYAKNHEERVQSFVKDEREDMAIIMLQRLLRGRSDQNMMYEGKEKRLDLIQELLTVANVEPLPENQVEDLLLQAHEEKLKDAVLESIQGEVMSRAFDMLSKELIRFKQEKKINKMVNIAENDRRTREAEERGRRQAEETLQRREDLLYQEIMKMHQGSVDTYLDMMMNNALESASSRQANQMATLKKEKIDNQIENLENKHSRPQAIIKDLLTSFLIPNIQRNKLQKRVELEERRFAETAKATLATTIASAKHLTQTKKE